MIGGCGLVVAAAIALFVVLDPTSGSAQPISSAHASQNGTTSREQPSPASFVRAVPTASAATTPRPVSTEPPKITYIIPVDADQSVKDALSDGIVTFEEYAQAVHNDMLCLDALGIAHSDPVYDKNSVQFHYSITSPNGPGAASSPEEDCYARYERDVHSAWVMGHGDEMVWEVVDEKGALQGAAKFGLKATSFADIIALKRANPQDPAITSCFSIGTLGFDPSVPR
jgi:hypothetical protein